MNAVSNLYDDCRLDNNDVCVLCTGNAFLSRVSTAMRDIDIGILASVCHALVLQIIILSSAYGSPIVLVIPILQIIAKFGGGHPYGGVEYRRGI